MSRQVSAVQAPGYTSAVATVVSRARLSATISGHSISRLSSRSMRTYGRPGQISKNQKATATRTGPPMSGAYRRPTARPETPTIDGHSQNLGRRIGRVVAGSWAPVLTGDPRSVQALSVQAMSIQKQL